MKESLPMSLEQYFIFTGKITHEDLAIALKTASIE